MSDTPKTLLVLGATSDIGRATAHWFARAGWNVMLAGRSLDALGREADDIATRFGVSVTAHALDILTTGSFADFLDGLYCLPDVVVSAVGLLGDQGRAESELAHAVEVVRTNFEGPALVFDMVAARMIARGSGTLVGISSVAGDRGRASNYSYGAAKAGFTAFLSGLRNRTAGKGVHVVTLKPGFVRTRMTEGMRLPGLLTAEPAEVAKAIFKAVEAKRDIVYVRSVWWFVMTIICAIPEGLFKNLKL